MGNMNLLYSEVIKRNVFDHSFLLSASGRKQTLHPPEAGFNNCTDAAEPDDKNRKTSEPFVEPEPARALANSWLESWARVADFRGRARAPEYPIGYEGQVDWVSFLFGFYFFGQAKKKNLGCRDQPRRIVVSPLQANKKQKGKMVAGDRIELPTRGFSIPCSTN
jgi:hypothetical protein